MNTWTQLLRASGGKMSGFMSALKVHVLPVNDLKVHAESELCECRPRIEQSGNGWLIVHNSYDGRELFEVEPTFLCRTSLKPSS